MSLTRCIPIFTLRTEALEKAKTDLVDARTISFMLMSSVSLKPCTNIAYHISEIKSPKMYRFDKVSEQAKLKTSVSRFVISFHEL